MRYYRIIIRDPVTGEVFREFTSLDSRGRFILGALNVEFDIPIVAYGTPGSGSFVRVWGVPLTDILQASNFNDYRISVFAGMSKGLPLAKPEQQGPLIEGYIYQAYGNWVGTSQSLDFQILPGQGPKYESGNFTLDYRKDTPLAQAIQNTLQTAYPGYTIDVSRVSPDLVMPYDQPGQYGSLTQFADFIRSLSLSINPATSTSVAYSGVNMVFFGNTITVLDNAGAATAPKDILFTDLIGQPTWFSPFTFQFNCVLRGDLQIGMYVRMPEAQFTTLANSLSRFRQRSAFSGVAQIMGDDAFIRHVGNFRQPDGTAWVTTVNCVVPPS